jgi:hypothetical protein
MSNNRVSFSDETVNEAGLLGTASPVLIMNIQPHPPLCDEWHIKFHKEINCNLDIEHINYYKHMEIKNAYKHSDVLCYTHIRTIR